MSNFDPAAFVDLEINAPLERRPPIPVGDYTAMVGAVTCVPWQSKDATKSGLRYVVPLKVQIPPATKQQLGLETDSITLTDSIMLDMNEAGQLDLSPGRNGGLRRYREALNMNQPGVPFSARKMEGQLILVKVKHEEWNGNIQERVDGVARAM